MTCRCVTEVVPERGCVVPGKSDAVGSGAALRAGGSHELSDRLARGLRRRRACACGRTTAEGCRHRGSGWEVATRPACRRRVSWTRCPARAALSCACRLPARPGLDGRPRKMMRPDGVPSPSTSSCARMTARSPTSARSPARSPREPTSALMLHPSLALIMRLARFRKSSGTTGASSHARAGRNRAEHHTQRLNRKKEPMSPALDRTAVRIPSAMAVASARFTAPATARPR